MCHIGVVEGKFLGVYMSNLLQVGEKAIDFTLPSHAGAAAGDDQETVTLSDYRGKNVVLVFYPADFSSVCGDQLVLYNEIMPMFKKYNAEILGISVDSSFCHAAFRESRNLEMPLLADFEPKGEIAKKYGAYRTGNGFCERALFVIDKEGTVRWNYLSPVEENPGADGILKALKEIEAEKGESANG